MMTIMKMMKKKMTLKMPMSLSLENTSCCTTRPNTNTEIQHISQKEIQKQKYSITKPYKNTKIHLQIQKHCQYLTLECVSCSRTRPDRALCGSCNAGNRSCKSIFLKQQFFLKCKGIFLETAIFLNAKALFKNCNCPHLKLSYDFYLPEP